MKKNTLLAYLLFVYLSACGFQPILKQVDLNNLKIKSIKFEGETNLVFNLKSSLNIKTNPLLKESNKINIAIKKNVYSKTKNSSGITTQEDLQIIIFLKILNTDDKIVYDDEFSLSKSIDVSNNPVSDDEKKNTEIRNLINNLSNQIIFTINYQLNNLK